MSDTNSIDAAAGAMRAMGDDPWRGPRYALVAWALGPAPFLLLMLLRLIPHRLVDDGPWLFLFAVLVLFLQWACLLASVVVVSHGCVRSCAEGWCLIGYWVAKVGLLVALYREDYLTCGGWLDAMLLTAAALPLAAATRWLLGQRSRARVSAA
jgi:hypothetical protein